MLLRVLLLMYVPSLSIAAQVSLDGKPLIVKMDADQVVQTFKTVISSPYFKEMAKEIAENAVKQYVKELKNIKEEDKESDDFHKSIRLANNDASLESSMNGIDNHRNFEELQPIQAPFEVKVPAIKLQDDGAATNNSILSETAALALLRDPSPDGDLGLDLDSIEHPTTLKPVSAAPMKINGMYFRRWRRRSGTSNKGSRFKYSKH